MWQLGKERCLRIARLETQLTFQRSRREAIEAAIHDLEPELKLPTPNRGPIPCAPAMRSRRWRWTCCEGPAGVAEIAVRVLAAKELPLPPPGIRKMTRARLRAPIHRAGEAWGRSDGRDWAGGEAPADGQNPTLPRPGRARWRDRGGKRMTWDQMLTWLILPVIVGGGIAYVIVWLRSGTPRSMSRRKIMRGQSSSRDPVDDVW